MRFRKHRNVRSPSMMGNLLLETSGNTRVPTICQRKSGRVKRSFDKTIEVSDSGNKKRIRRLLPYLGKKG